MRRSLAGTIVLALALLLLAFEAAVVLARFSVFAGASAAVVVRRWQWSDALRLGGAAVLAALGYGLRRTSRPPRDGRPS